MRRGKRRVFSNIILIAAVLVFLFSGYKLFSIFMEYRKGDKEYENLQETVVEEQTIKQEEEEETAETVVFTVDFEKLKEINSETVAWIRFVEPSKISYPVVQTLNNDKYLNTTFEGKRNASGAIFMDAANANDFSDRNTFIYGHNMKNGSMFAQLRKYKDAAFCRQNPYFYIYTPDGLEIKYEIFAVAIVEHDAINYEKNFANDNEYLTYLKIIRDTARYRAGGELDAGAQIVSLSTCTNVTETQRLLVHGVKREQKVLGE